MLGFVLQGLVCNYGSGCIWDAYMGVCQNYGPFLGTINFSCRIIIGTQKGTIILITAHMVARVTLGIFLAGTRPTASRQEALKGL